LAAQGASDPDDLTGEVFLQVVRALPGFAGDEDGLRSWVFTIAHHRLIDDRRKRQRRATDPRPHEEMEGALGHVLAEDEALARLGGEEVLALLGRLTEEQRTVLALRLVANLTIPEIAEILGRTVNATKALQRRGLNTLREQLAHRKDL
jgi:RNA polymerase sigma-70 factor (ECF subfamily)